MTRAVLVALATGMTAQASGCSILLMEKPPDQVGQAYPECSDGPGAPIADVSLAILWGLIGAGSWNDAPNDGDDFGDDERNILLVFGGLTVLHTTSAVLGGKWMSECEQRRAAWEQQRLRYNRPSDPQPTADPPPDPPRPPRGDAGQPCYPNGTCNRGFTCDLPTGSCRAEASSPGAADVDPQISE